MRMPSALRLTTLKDSFFSDCHRGDNSFADDFANNKNLYFHALRHYYSEGFIYCELGDGTELWENIKFDTVLRAHKSIYELLQLFFTENRLHIIYGDQDYVKKHLYTYFDHLTGKDLPLSPSIQFPEALVLEHETTKQELFCTQGHQADFINSLEMTTFILFILVIEACKIHKKLCIQIIRIFKL